MPTCLAQRAKKKSITNDDFQQANWRVEHIMSKRIGLLRISKETICTSSGLLPVLLFIPFYIVELGWMWTKKSFQFGLSHGLPRFNWQMT